MTTTTPIPVEIVPAGLVGEARSLVALLERIEPEVADLSERAYLLFRRIDEYIADATAALIAQVAADRDLDESYAAFEASDLVESYATVLRALAGVPALWEALNDVASHPSAATNNDYAFPTPAWYAAATTVPAELDPIDAVEREREEGSA